MKRLTVSVVYALPDTATEVELVLPAGSTVADALRSSGLASRHPGVDFAHGAIGVFGRRVALTTVLAYGDRVEFYRPLQANPKEGRARRTRRNRIQTT